eukprot:1143006-Rhodomonas_salina.1
MSAQHIAQPNRTSKSHCAVEPYQHILCQYPTSHREVIQGTPCQHPTLHRQAMATYPMSVQHIAQTSTGHTLGHHSTLHSHPVLARDLGVMMMGQQF